MKTIQRGFIVPLLLVIIALLLAGGGAYVYTQIKQVNPGVTGGLPIATSTTGTSVQQDTNAKTKKNISAVGKCGLNIASPLADTFVAFPLTISGTVDNTSSESLGCAWQMSEGDAGGAQLYFNYKNQGWKSLRTVSIRVENWMSTKTTFSFTMPFDNESMGLPPGTPMKIVFTEDNPSGLPPVDTFELPIILK